MEISQLLVIAAGALLGLLAFLLGRGDRLSSGYGVTWMLAGLLLVAWGLIGPAVVGWLLSPPGSASPFLILTGLLILLVLIGLLLFQAASLSRLKERVLRMAQEIALLRSALENRAPDRKDTGTDDGAPAP